MKKKKPSENCPEILVGCSDLPRDLMWMYEPMRLPGRRLLSACWDYSAIPVWGSGKVGGLTLCVSLWNPRCKHFSGLIESFELV